MWDRFANFIARFKTFLLEVGGWIVFLIALLIVLDVSGRSLLGLPLPSVYELTEQILMVACIFFALSSAPQIEMTIVTSRYKPKAKHLFVLMKHFFVMVFLSAMSWQAVEMAVKSWRQHHTSVSVLSFPTFPGRASLALGCVLFTIVELITIVEEAKNGEFEKSPRSRGNGNPEGF